MKRILCFLTVLVLLLVSGCSGKKQQADKVETASTVLSTTSQVQVDLSEDLQQSLKDNPDYKHPEFRLITEGSEPTNKIYSDYNKSGKDTVTLKNFTGLSLVGKKFSGKVVTDLMAYFEKADVADYGPAPVNGSGESVFEAWYIDNGASIMTTDYDVYYIEPDMNRYYHKSAMAYYEIDPQFKDFLLGIYNYYPYNYYRGRYIDGTLAMAHKYAGKTSVQMSVKDIYAYGEERTNYVIVELVSDVAQELKVVTNCYYSDDNRGTGDSKPVSLKAGEPQEVTLKFSYGTTLEIIADNNLFKINLQYGNHTTKSDLEKAMNTNKWYDHPVFNLVSDPTTPKNKVYQGDSDIYRSSVPWAVRVSAEIPGYEKSKYCRNEIGEELLNILNSAGSLGEGKPMEYATPPENSITLETKDNRFFIDPATDYLYDIEREIIIEHPEELDKLLHDIIYYYPTNLYRGKYSGGNLNLEHIYAGESEFSLQVKDIYAFEKSTNNYILAELTAKENTAAFISVSGGDSSWVYLEADKPQTVYLKFSNCDKITLNGGNNSIEIEIEYAR